VKTTLHRRRRTAITATAAIALLSLSQAAEAYLDPSTGSLILSAIIGLIATIGLAVKTWWYKLKSLFRRNPPDAASPVRDAGHPGKDKAAGR
jgi:hypothetical protein